MSADHTSRRPTPLLCGVTCVLTSLISMAIPRGASTALPAESRGTSVWAAVQLVQEEGAGDETDVPPQDVDKYIKVYQAMQHNRNLTVSRRRLRRDSACPLSAASKIA